MSRVLIRMLNLGILISGKGSNMEAILKSIKSRKTRINPAIVISNKSDARGIRVAEKYNVKTAIVESIVGETRRDYDMRVVGVLKKYKVTPRNGLVCLAGFMRIISPEFTRMYKNRILNIHPALLPSFPGLHAQRQALEYGVKYTGCTVHYVDEGIDTGRIIIQKVVKVEERDTEEILSARILKSEHKIYSKAIRLIIDKKI